MENQVQQLKLNVKNIKSVLVKSNKELYGVKKSKSQLNKKIASRNKLSQKEKKLEKPFKKIDKKTIEKKVSDESNPLERLFGAGILLGAGVVINAAAGFKKAFDDFKEENKPLFDTIGNIFQIIYDGVTGIFNSFTGPESKEGAFDWLGKFDDQGNITGGLIKDIDNAYKELDPLIRLIEKHITGSKILAKQGGVEGYKNTKTGKFTAKEWTDEERERYTSFSSDSNIPLDDKGRGTGPTDNAHGSGGGNHQSSVGFVPGKGNKQKGIFLHWSAGSHTTPYSAYHSIALGDGTMVRNTPYDQDKSGHTGGANTNSVGLAIAAAAGAQERGKLGQYAPTDAQLDAMTLEAAKLAVKWGWSEATIDKNVRTHGEWERYATRNGILSGSPQRWDLDRLKDGDPLIDASKVLSYGGNQLREMIKQRFRDLKIQERTQQGKASISPVVNNNANKLASTGPVEGSRDVAVVLMGEQ